MAKLENEDLVNMSMLENLEHKMMITSTNCNKPLETRLIGKMHFDDLGAYKLVQKKSTNSPCTGSAGSKFATLSII